MPRIVALDGHTLNPGDNPWDSIASLGDLTVYPRSSPAELLDRARSAEIVVTNKAPLSAGAIAELPTLRLIAVTATGYNIIDVPSASRRGVLVCNVPEYGTDSVAQFTIALLLELCSQVGVHDAAVKQGEWERSPDFCLVKRPLVQLAGLTMGLIGLGRIGRRVALLAQALGMNVIAAGRSRPEATAPASVVFREIDGVFAEADVISLHCPLTPQTQGLVNARQIATMKPTAMLINTARGGLVVEADLAVALRENRLAGAAVDVVSVEPIRSDNPLLHAPRCIITPHIAWATLTARRALMRTTADNIRAFLVGSPINFVNAR